MFQFFHKKTTNSAFTFAGNRPHIRTEDELSNIDKEEADNAYKQYKKKSWIPFYYPMVFVNIKPMPMPVSTPSVYWNTLICRRSDTAPKPSV